MQQCQSLRTGGRFSLEDRLSKPISSSCPKITSLFHALKEDFNAGLSVHKVGPFRLFRQRLWVPLCGLDTGDRAANTGSCISIAQGTYNGLIVLNTSKPPNPLNNELFITTPLPLSV